jgi:hypothetical protein
VCRSRRSERGGAPGGVWNRVPQAGARGPVPRAELPEGFEDGKSNSTPLMHTFVLCFITTTYWPGFSKLHCFIAETW